MGSPQGNAEEFEKGFTEEYQERKVEEKDKEEREEREEASMQWVPKGTIRSHRETGSEDTPFVGRAGQ